MSESSGIQWTDATWNPVVGCTPVSPGCLNCYAAQMAGTRLASIESQKKVYAGLTERRGGGYYPETEGISLEQFRTPRIVFNGTVRCLPERLGEPLRWKKPRRVFVNSMSDLFHEAVPFEFVDKVFAVMALAPQHTFQVLTKRPERMAEYLAGLTDKERLRTIMNSSADGGQHRPGAYNLTSIAARARGHTFQPLTQFLPPFRNVWLGTSCEDQARARERIPHLLACPTAVRFLSLEPLLGPIDLRRVPNTSAPMPGCPNGAPSRRVDWVIVGGESGKRARPCNVEWVRSIMAQCRAAGVPCFVKQLGARPCVPIEEPGRANWGTAIDHVYPDTPPETVPLRLVSTKGGDPAEWPEDLRVREFPREAVRA